MSNTHAHTHTFRSPANSHTHPRIRKENRKRIAKSNSIQIESCRLLWSTERINATSSTSFFSCLLLQPVVWFEHQCQSSVIRLFTDSRHSLNSRDVSIVWAYFIYFINSGLRLINIHRWYLNFIFHSIFMLSAHGLWQFAVSFVCLMPWLLTMATRSLACVVCFFTFFAIHYSYIPFLYKC